jgi:hypothetical protein
LEQSLRAEIDGYLNSHLSSLQDEIARLQSQLNEAFTRLNERLESAAQSDASVAVAISEHLRNARNTGIETASAEGARARASSDIAILKAAVDDIDEQRTQADILNSLINRAASFAPRVAFFVVKNERATGWRARGLAGTVGDDAIRELSLPLSSDTLLSAVVRSRRTWSGAPGTHAEDHLIYSHLSEEPPQRIVAVPLVARDKAVAVLYADCAMQDAEAISLEAIETLVRVAGMAVELLATKRPAPSGARGSAVAEERPQERIAAHEPEPATSASTPFTRDEPAPQPLTGAPQAETVDTTERVPPPLIETPAQGADAGGAHDFGSTTPVAAQLVEESAPAAPPSTFNAPLGTARRYGADAELPVEVSEGERRFHNDARRFARLLVSEIKLYNEQKVREGRDAGDLYNRLREDIDRSRQMYDKRVAPEVAGRFDYFHQELVNTLAEGDSAKLGDGYPGATVAA